jgi:hypothetical protein
LTRTSLINTLATIQSSSETVQKSKVYGIEERILSVDMPAYQFF